VCVCVSYDHGKDVYTHDSNNTYPLKRLIHERISGIAGGIGVEKSGSLWWLVSHG
jgi:hypothetical protein